MVSNRSGENSEEAEDSVEMRKFSRTMEFPLHGRPKCGNSHVLLNVRDSTEFAHSTEFSPFLLLTIPVGPPYEKCAKHSGKKTTEIKHA